MRRAFPQKVKPVSCVPSGSQAAPDQPKQSPPGINRKARTSAAMLGLALSMGASSLLIPRHDDRASAAEPRHTNSEVVATSPESETVSLEPVSEFSVPESRPIASSSGETFSHQVAQGQTLRSIARQYRVPLRSLASANGVASNATVRIGQSVRIPALPAALSALRESRSVESLPQISSTFSEDNTSKGSLSSSSSDIASVRGNYRVSTSRQSAIQSLSRLRSQREQLRDSLAGLKLEGSEYNPEKAVLPTLNPSPRFESTAEPTRRSGLEIADLVPSEADTLYHVKPGDTLGAIARAYDVPQRVLQAVNQLDNPDVLRINQPLVVPRSEASPSATVLIPALAANLDARSSSNFSLPDLQNRASERTIAHRVTFGDTLGQIAQESGVSKETLIQANQIANPDVIRVGQLIQIPTSTSLASIPDANSNPSVPANEGGRSPFDQSIGGADPTVSSVSASVLVNRPTVPDTRPEIAEAGAIQSGGTAIFSTEFVGTDLAHSSVSTYPIAPRRVQPTQEPSIQPGSSESQRSFSNLQRLMEDVAHMRRYVESRSSEPKPASGQLVQVDVQSLVVAVAPQNPTVPTSDELQSFEPVDVSSPIQEANPAEPESVEASPPALVQSEQDVQAPQSLSSASDETPQLVAAASLGSENYSPLLEPLVGRMVSPELPALAGAEAFLPQGSATFNGYIWPARGVLTSGYGWRWGRMHRGIDVAAPVGTPVVAAAAGVVQYAGWNSGGYGNMIDIRHPDGSMTRYAHNSRLLVRIGQEVAQGEQIAAMGSTGYSTGPHVHFEVHLPSQGAVNPATYLARR